MKQKKKYSILNLIVGSKINSCFAHNPNFKKTFCLMPLQAMVSNQDEPFSHNVIASRRKLHFEMSHHF